MDSRRPKKLCFCSQKNLNIDSQITKIYPRIGQKIELFFSVKRVRFFVQNKTVKKEFDFLSKTRHEKEYRRYIVGFVLDKKSNCFFQLKTSSIICSKHEMKKNIYTCWVRFGRKIELF